MFNCDARTRLARGMGFVFLCAAIHTRAVGQATNVGRRENQGISCSVRLENQTWRPGESAAVVVTVQNLNNGPLRIPLWARLSLDPLSPPRVGWPPKVSATLGAGVDPAAVHSTGLPSNVILQYVNGKPMVELRFSRKDERAEFKVEAQELVWDYEIVSRTPTLKLFDAAKPGRYDLQFHMWSASDSWDSGKVRLTIAPVKPPK